MREKLSLTQDELAKKVGVSTTTIQNYENGQLPRGEHAIQLASLFEITIDSLLLDSKTLESIIKNSSSSNDSDIVFIPMVKARLSAGGGSFETHGDYECTYSFRHDFLVRKGNPKNMVLMRVSGDSMQPEIMDNDVVLIDQSKTDIQQGKMFAVGFEDCIYLKRIDLLPGQVVLTSTNEKYAPVIIDLNDDYENLFRVIGKVLWCGREYL